MPIRFTQSVKILLIVSFVAFLIQQTGDRLLGTHLMSLFGLVPHGVLSQGRIWQLITYAFIHTDVMHLFFNLMMIAFIGAELEVHWGSKQFLRYYFFCLICSGLVYLGVSGWIGGDQFYRPLVGASGAIYGLLMAYGLLFGERVLLFMMLFPMKAKHFIWVLALIQIMTTLYSPGGGWASLAHLTGMIAGLGYLWGRTFFRGGKQTRPPKKRKSKHLKLVINNGKEGSSDPDQEDHPRTWH